MHAWASPPPTVSQRLMIFDIKRFSISCEDFWNFFLVNYQHGSRLLASAVGSSGIAIIHRQPNEKKHKIIQRLTRDEAIRCDAIPQEFRSFRRQYASKWHLVMPTTHDQEPPLPPSFLFFDCCSLRIECDQICLREKFFLKSQPKKLTKSSNNWTKSFLNLYKKQREREKKERAKKRNDCSLNVNQWDSRQIKKSKQQ